MATFIHWTALIMAMPALVASLETIKTVLEWYLFS